MLATLYILGKLEKKNGWRLPMDAASPTTGNQISVFLRTPEKLEKPALVRLAFITVADLEHSDKLTEELEEVIENKTHIGMTALE